MSNQKIITPTKSQSETALSVKKAIKRSRKLRKIQNRKTRLLSSSDCKAEDLTPEKVVQPQPTDDVDLKLKQLVLKNNSKNHLLPPSICETLGIPTNNLPARAYPPYCVKAFTPVLTEVSEPVLPIDGIGASSSQPDGITAAQGLADLPCEGSTVPGVSSEEGIVAAPSVQFPCVLMRELCWYNGRIDVMHFFRGFRTCIVDVLLVFMNGTFTGDAYVVFSNTKFADAALKKDGEMVGRQAVRVLPCRKQDYYNAVASTLNVDLSFSDSQANPTDRSTTDTSLMEQPSVTANMSCPDSPLGRSTSLCNNIMDHKQPETEAKIISEIDEDCKNDVVAPKNDGLDKTKPKKRIKRHRKAKVRHILRVCVPDHLADTNVITSVFGDCDLSKDRVHIIFHSNGKPTGEIFLECVSEEDANKVISKDNTLIGSHHLKILPATMEDLRAKNAEQKQEIGGNDWVKESNDDPKLPDSCLQGKQEKSNDEQKVISGFLRMNNVPPSADKCDIIELFGEYHLLPENVHCDCQPNGIATGVVYVEFNSVEDAKNALSKNTSKIHSQCVELSISSKEQAMTALNEKW